MLYAITNEPVSEWLNDSLIKTITCHHLLVQKDLLMNRTTKLSLLFLFNTLLSNTGCEFHTESAFSIKGRRLIVLCQQMSLNDKK